MLATSWQEYRTRQRRVVQWSVVLAAGWIGYLISGWFALDLADATFGGNQWWMQIPRVFLVLAVCGLIGLIVTAIRAARYRPKLPDHTHQTLQDPPSSQQNGGRKR